MRLSKRIMMHLKLIYKMKIKSVLKSHQPRLHKDFKGDIKTREE